jgi:hypothetical protein
MSSKGKQGIAVKNFDASSDALTRKDITFEGWMSVANFIGKQKFWKKRFAVFVLLNVF